MVPGLAMEIDHMRLSGEATNLYNGYGKTDWPNRIDADVIMRSGDSADHQSGRAWGPIASGAADVDDDGIVHFQARCWAIKNNHVFVGAHAVQIPAEMAPEGRRQLQGSNGCEASENSQGQGNAADAAFNKPDVCGNLFAACCISPPCASAQGLFGDACPEPPCAESCNEPPCGGNRNLVVKEKEDDCIDNGSCQPGSTVIYVFSNIGEDTEGASDAMFQEFDVFECAGFGELAGR